jgi:hypothetical protein
MLRGSLVATALAALVILLAHGTSYADCETFVTLGPVDDYYLPVSETYGPCYPDVSWSFKFYRNGDSYRWTIIQFKIDGTGVQETYDSRDFELGWHSFQGTDEATASENTMKIYRLVYESGYFEQITATATYSE